LALFFGVVLLASVWPDAFFSSPPPDLPNADWMVIISKIIFIGLPTVVLVNGTFRKTIELYAMTYWIEKNAKWKQSSLNELQKLKEKLLQEENL